MSQRNPPAAVVRHMHREATMNEEYVWECESDGLRTLLTTLTELFLDEYSPADGDRRIFVLRSIEKEIPGMKIVKMPDPEKTDHGKVY